MALEEQNDQLEDQKEKLEEQANKYSNAYKEIEKEFASIQEERNKAKAQAEALSTQLQQTKSQLEGVKNQGLILSGDQSSQWNSILTFVEQKISENRNEWSKVEKKLTKASSNLLTIKEKVSKLAPVVDKILIYMRDTQNAGRLMLETQENLIAEIKEL